MVDQFTQDVSNHRTDRWGGTIPNRSRFALEVSRAVISAIGASRVGIRLSPWSTFQAMKMADPIPQFTHLITQLRALKLGYLHLVTSRVQGSETVAGDVAIASMDFALRAWGPGRPVILAGGYTGAGARETVDETYAEYEVLVAFGRFFISTPDLPFRLERGLEPTGYDRASFYVPKSRKGYTDYPFSEEWEAQSKL